MGKYSVIYHWEVQFGDGFKAKQQVLRLSLQGDEGSKETEVLRDDRTDVRDEIARPNFRAAGRLRETPARGNLERGRITVEGPPVVIKDVAVKGDGAVWISERLGLVDGSKDFVFLIESEESHSPLNIRNKVEADKRLQREEPEAWARQVRERNALIQSATGIALPDPTVPERAASKVVDTSAGNPLPEAELAAYRAQGLTDAQILERTTNKGRTLRQQEGRPAKSSEPNYGRDYEGFSLQSAPVVKLADDEERAMD